MAYEEDLPNLFAELPNLIIGGFGDPASLAAIWSTGKLPQQQEPSGPTLADLEEQFQQQQGDTYTDILSSTGDPHQAGIIANSQSQEAINAAVNQSMINILAKDENKISLAADAVMSYQGPIDPDMNVADIVAPIYNVSPTKVEAELDSRGELVASLTKPFYEMDLDQPISVQPEIIDINKPVSMAGDPGFNQAIDNYRPPGARPMPAPPPDVGTQPPAGWVEPSFPIQPAEIDPATGQPFAPIPSSPEIMTAGPPDLGVVGDVASKLVSGIGGSAANLLFKNPDNPGDIGWMYPWTPEGKAAWEAQHAARNAPPPAGSFLGAGDPLANQDPPPFATAPVGPPSGVISDDPEAMEERAINDAVMDGWLGDLQRVFQNVPEFPHKSMDNAYFLARIEEIMNTPEGQGSGFAGRSAEDILASWGENPRFMQVVTSSEVEPGITDEGQPTATVTTKTAEVPAGPLQGTPVDAAAAAPILTRISAPPREDGTREFNYFRTPEGLDLWFGPDKNLWGTVPQPDRSVQLISYGELVEGITQGDDTEYTLGGHTWTHDPTSARPWQLKRVQPAVAMAGGAPLPLQSTLGSMTPPKQWETLRAQEMGEDIWNPVRWGTRMQGFKPAYGQWLLSGKQFESPFHEFVQSGAQPDMAQTWQELARASAGLTSPLDLAGADELALGRQIGYQGLITGDAARTNAILMAAAAMGAGQGYGADAMRAQLGSMYDVFAAEAAASGQPAGGFIDWLNQRIVDMPGSPAPAGAPGFNQRGFGGQGGYGT